MDIGYGVGNGLSILSPLNAERQKHRGRIYSEHSMSLAG